MKKEIKMDLLINVTCSIVCVFIITAIFAGKYIEKINQFEKIDVDERLKDLEKNKENLIKFKNSTTKFINKFH